MGLYLDIAKKVTVANTRRPSPAGRERGRGVIIEADDDRSQVGAPASALTPGRSLLLGDLSGSGSRSSGAASVAQVHHTTSLSKVDIEFDRFAAVAVPMADGFGWFDPINGSPEMPAGVPWLDWQRFENNCSYLGKGARA